MEAAGAALSLLTSPTDDLSDPRVAIVGEYLVQSAAELAYSTVKDCKDWDVTFFSDITFFSFTGGSNIHIDQSILDHLSTPEFRDRAVAFTRMVANTVLIVTCVVCSLIWSYMLRAQIKAGAPAARQWTW